MLTREENDLLTRVTGDAPAGQMMRQYWLPACWSEEVAEPDGTPVRVRMFGENFVAFRDSAGNVGLVDASCIADKVRIRSYPVRDAGGLIWVYLGPPELEPPFPAYGWTTLPRNQIAHMKFVENTNWLQAAEGTIDTVHSWFLHRGVVQDWKQRSELSMDLSPRLEAEDTDYGFRYAAIRRVDKDPDRLKYVKVTLYMFPSTAFIARPMTPDLPTLVQIFVPIDDEHTMHYSLFHTLNGMPIDEADKREKMRLRPGIDLDPGFRLRITEDNMWNQDRAAMKNGSWCGIEGFQNQDVACQESMGPIVDRTLEHLGTSDVAIIRLRRRMLEGVRGFMDGKPPVGLDVPVAYEKLRSEQRVIGIDEPWQQVGGHAGEYAPGRSQMGLNLKI